jgi:hypothetical protein
MPRGRKHPRQGERRVGLQEHPHARALIFQNLEAGMSPQEITEVYDVTPEEIGAVLQFVSDSLEREPAYG